MLIKLTEINDSKLGKFDAKEVVGTKIDDGQEWRKSFFANNRKLAGELAEFGIGDNLNVKMVQDGKFWNMDGITPATDAMIEKVLQHPKVGVGGAPAGRTYKNDVRGGGAAKPAYGKADPNKDGQIARAVALKAAIEFLGGKAKMTEEKLVECAKKFVPFLLDKETPFKEDEVKDGPDPLNPPPVD